MRLRRIELDQRLEIFQAGSLRERHQLAKTDRNALRAAAERSADDPEVWADRVHYLFTNGDYGASPLLGECGAGVLSVASALRTLVRSRLAQRRSPARPVVLTDFGGGVDADTVRALAKLHPTAVRNRSLVLVVSTLEVPHQLPRFAESGIHFVLADAHQLKRKTLDLGDGRTLPLRAAVDVLHSSHVLYHSAQADLDLGHLANMMRSDGTALLHTYWQSKFELAGAQRLEQRGLRSIEIPTERQTTGQRYHGSYYRLFSGAAQRVQKLLGLRGSEDSFTL